MSDRSINDALGLPETSEPIAACIDFSALSPAARFLEQVALMLRHFQDEGGKLRDGKPANASPSVLVGGRAYLSRSVVERLTGGAFDDPSSRGGA